MRVEMENYSKEGKVNEISAVFAVYLFFCFHLKCFFCSFSCWLWILAVILRRSVSCVWYFFGIVKWKILFVNLCSQKIKGSSNENYCSKIDKILFKLFFKNSNFHENFLKQFTQKQLSDNDKFKINKTSFYASNLL